MSDSTLLAQACSPYERVAWIWICKTSPLMIVEEFPPYGIYPTEPDSKQLAVYKKKLNIVDQVFFEKGHELLRSRANLQLETVDGFLRATRIRNCLPRLDQFWHLIDPTETFPELNSSKLTRGPKWIDQSCAIDAVIVAALMLNAFRCRADQLSASRVAQLNPAALFFRKSLSMAWSKFEPMAMREERTSIRQTLNNINPKNFPMTHEMGVMDIINSLFEGISQLQYTKAIKVNDGENKIKVRWNSDRSIYTKRQLGLSFPLGAHGLLKDDSTLEDRINICFAALPEQQVVVDRMPPVLMLNNNWETNGLFKDHWKMVTIKYLDHDMNEKSARYKPIGIIALNRGQKHFVVNWERASNDFIRYDGVMPGGLFVTIPNLLHGINGGTHMHITTFFKLAD